MQDAGVFEKQAKPDFSETRGRMRRLPHARSLSTESAWASSGILP
jgi:hypothetical protein